MMKKKLLSIVCVLCMMQTYAIDKDTTNKEGVTQWGVKTGQPQFPKGAYRELPDPAVINPELWKDVKKPLLSWGSTNIRYKKSEPPVAKVSNELTLTGWRGERVNAQALIWCNTPLEALNFSVTDLTGKAGTIKASETSFTGFARYVMTDQLNKDGKGGCGYRPDITIFDSSLVADPIDHITRQLDLKAMNTQGMWVRIWIPATSTPGIYKGKLLVKSGDNVVGELKLNIKVADRTLPSPSEWSYFLDFWQNPYAEARYFQVEPWSKEHFDVMRPSMKMLADAGQKVITASIMHKPWGGQAQDYYESMVTWIKKADGTWMFDFTVFDKWVEYMMSIGIKEQINCYSMIPWNLSFQYFDQATNSLKFCKTAPGEEAYAEMWTAMLKSFAAHLKQKGWFGITCIAMDERPQKAMEAALKVIKSADKDFRVSLAGNDALQFIEPELVNYSIASGHRFPADVLAKRKASGKISTYYTCCTEPYPNMFSFSPAAESEWLSWYASAIGLDGYLRWAYNCYTVEPLLDSRFRAFPGGDCYLVYPEGRTSIRFEKFLEGIQAFEKIKILRKDFEAKGNEAGLKKINDMLATFSLKNFPAIPAAETIEKARAVLNEL